ncbi:hypothetical protein QBC39DRAFT_436037 [Podospora conica]|nr:hypothetical protein QBC39DRAFT_436037 [Schizothecium conicum]
MGSRQMKPLPLAAQLRMVDIARRWEIPSLNELLPPGLRPPRFSRNLIMLINRLSRYLSAADASHHLQNAIRTRRAAEILAHKKVPKREFLTRGDALRVIADLNLPDLRFAPGAAADDDEDDTSQPDQRRPSPSPGEPSSNAAIEPEERAEEQEDDASSIPASTSSGASSARHRGHESEDIQAPSGAGDAAPLADQESKYPTPVSLPLEDITPVPGLRNPTLTTPKNPQPRGSRLTPPSTESSISSRELGSETAIPSSSSGACRHANPVKPSLKRRWAELADDLDLEVMLIEGRIKSRKVGLECARGERDDAHAKHAAIQGQVALLTEEAESIQRECLHMEERLPAVTRALEGLLSHIFPWAELPALGDDLDVRDPGGAIAQTIVTFRDTVASKLAAKEELERQLQVAKTNLDVAATFLESKVSEVSELEKVMAELEQELQANKEMSQLLSKKRV